MGKRPRLQITLWWFPRRPEYPHQPSGYYAETQLGDGNTHKHPFPTHRAMFNWAVVRAGKGGNITDHVGREMEDAIGNRNGAAPESGAGFPA